jgi:Asp-tRNA(Asn)/Glu-tRNA(Gln) amidotransferase A subunit family amidase
MKPGLDFAGLMAQVKSPSVKQALASLRGADAVSEDTYREALSKHRPALQETYRRYFRERGVAAMVFPTTPLPAAKIGEDDTVMLNGAPVSTLSTFIRNLAPGSAAGIPGLTLPAGMTKAGLPVGLAIDAPEKTTTSFWRSGSLSKPCCPPCLRRPFDRIGNCASATGRVLRSPLRGRR